MKLGSTLYAFTNEWHARQFDLDSLIGEIARRNLGPGLEVIGFSSLRGFPRIDDGFAAHFKEVVASHGLELSSLAVNADVGIRRGRTMSVDECVEYHVPQIEAAAKLGFPVVRLQFAMPVEAAIKLLPLAEKYGIKMGPEIHAPINPQSPVVMAWREAYAQVNSPLLGFVPDFGCCARIVPPSYLDSLRQQGMPEALLQIALDVWKEPKDAGWKRAEFVQRVAAFKPDPTIVSALSVMFNILSPGTADMWREIVPQVIHIHGKFYDFDADGNESAIDYASILPVFDEGGYQGYMSSEWEGHLYMRCDAFEKVAQHQALARRILGQA